MRSPRHGLDAEGAACVNSKQRGSDIVEMVSLCDVLGILLRHVLTPSPSLDASIYILLHGTECPLTGQNMLKQKQEIGEKANAVGEWDGKT